MAGHPLVEDNRLISIIVALDNNYLIGNQGKLPWNIPDDLRNFRLQTWGHPVIMGRVTYDSLPKKPLRGRLNIVVTKTNVGHDIFQLFDWTQIVYFQPNLGEAVKLAKMYCPNNDEIFIIGGRQIYETALNDGIVDKLYVTHVEGDYEGDTHFPKIPNEFHVDKIPKRQCEGYSYWTYEK